MRIQSLAGTEKKKKKNPTNNSQVRCASSPVRRKEITGNRLIFKIFLINSRV